MKQARSRRTHELVLDAAAIEFAQHGSRANLQDVADRTGLTKGALYGHFASKEDLAQALAEHLDRVVDALIAEVGAAELPALEQLRTLTCSLAERIESDMRMNAALRLVMDEAYRGLEPPKFLGSLRRLAVEVVERARKDGALGTEPPSAQLADLVIVLLVGAYYTADGVERSGLAQRVRDLWAAFAPRPGGPVDPGIGTPRSE